MKFNNHSHLNGLHALFSPSQPSWLNYDDDKFFQVYTNKKAAALGTRYHEWAAETIELGIKQSVSKKSSTRTIALYVNDAIGYKMTPEVPLVYGKFFGTADAICFRHGVLRIHDLKTGKTPAHIEQLMAYAALFCLEYRVKPGDIEIKLRIYQNDEVLCHDAETDEIVPIMDKIIHFNELWEKLDKEV